MTSNSSDDTQLPDAPPLPVPYSTSPVPRPSPWSFPPNNSLFRSRRPVRSRTVDFNDFTLRRRSSIRQGATQDTLVPRIDVTSEESSQSSQSFSVWDRPSVPSSPAAGRSPQSARRFFGLARNRRDISLPSASPDPGDTSYWAVEADSTGPWFGSRQPHPSHRYQLHETEGSEERNQDELPRLRRGGVRAPESMLSRTVSPVPGTVERNASSIVYFLAHSASENTAET